MLSMGPAPLMAGPVAYSSSRKGKKGKGKGDKVSGQVSTIKAAGPVDRKRVARYANMSPEPGRMTQDGINRVFPFIVDADIQRHKATEAGISPLWLATYENAVTALNNGGINEDAFAEYIFNEPATSEGTLRRHGAFRPFSDKSLGLLGVFKKGQRNQIANYITPEAALDAQYLWKMELDKEVGKHFAFLDLCSFVDRVYHDQRANGAAGYGADHLEEGQLEQTPYECLYNALFLQFDRTRLSLTAQEQAQATLGDLAHAARGLFVSQGHLSTIESVVRISDKHVLPTAFTDGYTYCTPAALSTTPEGDPVLMMPQFMMPGAPTKATSVTATGIDSLYPGQKLGSLNTAGGVAFHDGTVYTADALANLPGTCRLWGAPNVATAFINPMIAERNVLPIISDTITHADYSVRMLQDIGTEVTGIGLAASASNNNLYVKTLWNQQSHVVLDYLVKANRLLSPELVSYGETFSAISSGHGASSFEKAATHPDFMSKLYEEVNVHSPILPQFNPRSDSRSRQMNNGPYGTGQEDFYRVDELSASGREELLSEHFDHQSVSTGVGSTTTTFKNMFKALSPRVFSALFSTKLNPVSKTERFVVVPSGRTSSEGMMYGEISRDDYSQQFAMMRSSLGTTGPKHQWYLPGSDIRLNGSAKVSDLTYATALGTSYKPSDRPRQMIEIMPAGYGNLVTSGFTLSNEVIDNILVAPNLLWENFRSSRGASGSYTPRTAALALIPSAVAAEEFYVGASKPSTDGWDGVNVGISMRELMPCVNDFLARRDGSSDATVGPALSKAATITITNPATGVVSGYVSGGYAKRSDFAKSGGAVTLTDLKLMKTYDSSNPAYTHSAADNITVSNAVFAGRFEVEEEISKTFMIDGHFALDTGDRDAIFENLEDEIVGSDSGPLGLLSIPHGLTKVGDASTVAYLAAGSIMRILPVGLILRPYTKGEDRIFSESQGDGTVKLFVETDAHASGVAKFTEISTVTELANSLFPIAPSVPYAANMETQITNVHVDSAYGSNYGVDVTVLRPTKINMRVAPTNYLLMASLAKYCNMRFYPSATNLDHPDFAGLPFFGEPQPFMRTLVEEHAPELLEVDQFVANPLFSTTGQMASVMRTVYDPNKYVSAAHGDTVVQAAASHPGVTIESIQKAEEQILQRRTYIRL